MIEELKKRIGNVVEGELLSKYTTFKIGGPAKYFFDAKTSEDLVKALTVADELKVSSFVLGGGSNILVSDSGFNGLVIKQSNSNFKIDGEKVYSESGASVDAVLNATLDAGLIGWAWAAGLPGTVGGGIRGNAGAYGEGMSNVTESVDLYIDGKVTTYTNEQMQFSYRDSIAKHVPCVIISANLKLTKGDTAADRALVKKYVDHRVNTQPLEYPNPGCAFKNIDLKKIQVDKDRLLKKMEITEEEWQTSTKYGKLPTSFIFDRMNLKGKTIGGAQVSTKHGAFIVNVGNARAEHVVMLMSELKMRVRNELGIPLEEEVELVGF